MKKNDVKKIVELKTEETKAVVGGLKAIARPGGGGSKREAGSWSPPITVSK
jgi:hypothetical protein